MWSHACLCKLSFVSFLIGCININYADGYKDGHLIVRQTNRIKSRYVYSRRTYASKTECAWACRAAPRCGSVSWGPHGQCLLSAYKMCCFPVDRFTNKYQNRLLDWVSGWVTMAKLVYPGKIVMILIITIMMIMLLIIAMKMMITVSIS